VKKRTGAGSARPTARTPAASIQTAPR